MNYDLTIIIEGLACGSIEAGKFGRFPEAWAAMEELACGACTLKLVDERGDCRSLLMGFNWIWK